MAAITGSKLDLDIDEKVRTMEVEYIIEGRDGLSIPKSDVLQLLVGQFLNTSISSGNAIEGIVMKNYQQVIEADFIEDSFQKFYFMALQKENLQPVNRADVKDLDFKHGEHLSFQTVFEIEPEIKLPTMKKNSLKVEKTNYVTDKTDVDLAIDEIRRTYAEVMPVEDGAVDGDYILADLQKLD